MFKDYLKRIRAEKNNTQVQMAEALGVPQRTYEDWEAGRREPNNWTIELIKMKIKAMDGRLTEAKKFANYLWEAEGGEELGMFDTYEEAFENARAYIEDDETEDEEIIRGEKRITIEELDYNSEVDTWDSKGVREVIFYMPSTVNVVTEHGMVEAELYDGPMVYPGMTVDGIVVTSVESVLYNMRAYFARNIEFYACVRIEFENMAIGYYLIPREREAEIYADRKWNRIPEAMRMRMLQRARMNALADFSNEGYFELTTAYLNVPARLTPNGIEIDDDARTHHSEWEARGTVGRLLDEAIEYDEIAIYTTTNDKKYNHVMNAAYSTKLFDQIEIEDWEIMNPEEYREAFKDTPEEVELAEKTLVIRIDEDTVIKHDLL